ncbi:MAG TPA: sigma-54-dependent Fis family transcriptional regulator [Aromatoleum sp.]|uniref:sigma-54 interaction domain-containing protein n=1 Tax=Aromatoleum sp. TaxID=2307007 RepID=UPI002B474D79|nr:sigma-54-dependent Fis family transcriptional regulator [Aromatoleum sp.]HJV26810.1 sigma-54-dependent Fis family transcriptional regulator [Aromatoleum sp.]
MERAPLPELLSFLDAQPEPRILLDTDYRIVAANRAYAREFGDGNSVVGRRCFEVSHGYAVPCDHAGENCPIHACRDSGIQQRVLHLHHTPRGEEHVEVETTPLRDSSGEIAFFVEALTTVRQASSHPTAAGLVGRSPRFNRMLELATRVAPTDATVLLLGETGTGKELVARLLHESSRRAKGAFVAVDCSGLTESLFESELFGHEKGAFTGAVHRKRGLVEAASGGTLFLDELGDIPLAMQVKLLRLLETGTYRRVGGVEILRSDFRLVAATHRRLERMVEEGSFRADLYHRVNVFPIRVPSLAERREDIPLLANSFLERVAPGRGLNFSAAGLEALSARRYPGNIRELRNLVERATILADGLEIGPSELEGWEGGGEEASLPAPRARSDGSEAFVIDRLLGLDEVSERYVAWAEKTFPGDRRELAARLGVSIRTLYRKLATDSESTSAGGEDPVQ